MYDLFHHHPIVFTVTTGNKNADTDRKTDEKVDEQARKCIGRTDRTNGISAIGKLSNDNKVSRIIKKLQHIGQHQRNRKTYDLAKQWTVCHIDLIACTLSAPQYGKHISFPPKE